MSKPTNTKSSFISKLFSLPGLMLLSIVLALSLADVMPLELKEFFYSISLIIKELILFVLPIIIFTLLFSSMVTLWRQPGGIKVVLLLVPLVCLSNFTTTWVSYLIGNFFITGHFNILPLEMSAELSPMFMFKLPSIIKNEVALFSGIVTGFIAGILFADKAQPISAKVNEFVIFILRKAIVPVMPVFIFGFLVKLQHDKILSVLLEQYSYLFLIIVSGQVLYVSFLLLVGCGFNISRWCQAVRNIIPSMVTGFSTMSSASTLPLMFIAAEKNTKSPALSRMVVSTTVNIHLIGDCIAIPIAAFALLQNFGISFPSIETYFMFSLYFVLAKFAVAAVPGGGILVMLPILEQHLGFNTSMLSMITAIYIIFDPVTTSMNVGGNNTAVILFDKLYKKLFLRS